MDLGDGVIFMVLDFLKEYESMGSSNLDTYKLYMSSMVGRVRLRRRWGGRSVRTRSQLMACEGRLLNVKPGDVPFRVVAMLY